MDLNIDYSQPSLLHSMARQCGQFHIEEATKHLMVGAGPHPCSLLDRLPSKAVCSTAKYNDQAHRREVYIEPCKHDLGSVDSCLNGGHDDSANLGQLQTGQAAHIGPACSRHLLALCMQCFYA